jgi:tetratricopeptide (TPR) repeat protein
MPTLCLSMIVKNESKIITRLLKSVIEIIDTYCICDTGSTDNTIEVITDFFNNYNKCGKIVECPFRNFSYNRNYALNKSQNMADYTLLLDADMIFETKNFDKNILNLAEAFYIFQGNETFFYKNIRIVKNNGLFEYVGVTHEYINIPNNMNIYEIPKDMLFINDVGDGGCKSNKFQRDINLLTDGIKSEPNNSRYYFYLANSYYDIKKYDEAISIYEKRILMGGWIEEVWYSYYRMGLCYKNINKIHDAIYIWLEGFNYHSKRIENMYEIVKHYTDISHHKLANYFYKIAKKIAQEKDDKNIGTHLFFHKDIYDYKLDFEYTIFSSYVGVKNIDNSIVSILNKCSDEIINITLLKNMKFYKQVIYDPSHCKKISFNDEKIITINNIEHFFNSSSSCLIYNNERNGFIMNLRYVNYSISEKGDYSYKNNAITLNRTLYLTNNFEIIRDEWIDTIFDNRTIMGIEDIRIFNNNGTILFIGNSFHKNENWLVCVGDYNNKIVSKDLSCDFNYSECEKNWVYFHYKEKLNIIYKWYPLQIAKINDDANCIELVETKKMPRIFSHCRGSTCGFSYNDEIWFIVHIVSYENPRQYYHMIVVFDENMDFSRYSAPFKFEGEPIEYCLSIIVNNENVIINYSTWDKTSQIVVFDKSHIDQLLIFNDE